MIRASSLIAAIVLTAWGAWPAIAGDSAFPKEFLQNEQQILLGRQVFFERCTYCHAKKGVGKAPQLRPSERNADFIFGRVTDGFQGMPSWGLVLTEEQRRALVAFILSDPDKY